MRHGRVHWELEEKKKKESGAKMVSGLSRHRLVKDQIKVSGRNKPPHLDKVT